MIRHGSSHGFSVLICTILAALLVDLLRPTIPHFLSKMERVSQFFIATFSLPFSQDQFNIILVASILAVLWGMFFKMNYSSRNT